MFNSKQINPFGFLNKRRKHVFCLAIDAKNKQHQVLLSNHAHIYPHLSPRGKATTIREWLIAFIMDAISDEDGAKRREINNISGIEFDNQYFVYFKKIDDPDQPPHEPKTIIRARNMPYQPPLFEETPPKDTPLHDLYPIIAGYVRGEGLITGLYFIDQNEPKVRYEQLDLTISIAHREQSAPQLPKSTFTLKAGLKKKDEVK